MAYKRIKIVQGKRYAYNVETVQTKNGPRQRVLGYLGRVGRDSSPNIKVGTRCSKCGSHINLSLDHKYPLSHGGTHTRANLQTLCLKCNQAKSDSVSRNNVIRRILY